MVKSDKVVALIPLRGGSKSIPKKNIRFLAGRPLCGWVIQAASDAHSINEVFVSTDSREIRNVVEQMPYPVKVCDRPAEFASDEASTESVMLHFADLVEFDLLVTIQATSPLLTSADLDAAIKVFRAGGYDSMLSAVRTKRFFWTDDGLPINYDPRNRPRRQDFAGTLMENGAFYITKRDVLLSTGCRLGGKVGIYEMDEGSAVEIDEPDDWDKVVRLLEER
jgi:N-acylneuraminate cytidylyltransferase